MDERIVACAWVRARLDDYVDGAEGGLTAPERATVARHLAVCDSCRADFDAAAAVLRELRAFPLYEAPASVVAAAERVLGGGDPVVRLPGRWGAVLQWLPAGAAAAALVALMASARWGGPVSTAGSGIERARIERAARETMLAFSYVNRYARRTGEIVAGDVLEKHVLGSVGRAVEHGVPKLRRAVERSGIAETPEPQERS